MPRLRILLLLTLLVAAGHWWLLADLPWGSTAPALDSPAAAPVFETRTMAPPAPPPPPPAPPPPPRPRPPRPPVPAPAPAPEPAVEAPQEAMPAPTEPDTAAPVDAGTTAATDVDADADAAAKTTEADASTDPAAPPPGAPEAHDADPDDAPNRSPLQGAGNVPAQGITLRTAPGQPVQTELAYQAPPAQLLTFQVQGQAKGFSYSASARLRWQPQGSSYLASQEISAFLLGARSQSSQGHITPSGLLPDRFEDRARKKLRAASMDWASGLARFEPEAPLARIAPGTQDRLSVFLQLAGLLAAAPERYPEGAEITLPTASTSGIDSWHFQVHRLQQLELPAGPLEALQLERRPQAGRDQKAELWLAPSLGYLPVRIRLSESNGDYADLRLQSHTAP